MTTNVFQEPFEVRDCECDLQGIVNNAVYQQYLEHARHKYLRSRGLDFAALTREGVHLVVVRAELDYRAPLRSGDAFEVTARLERLSPLRFVFRQEVYRRPDRKLMLEARVVCTAMNERGRPMLPRAVERLFGAS